MTEPDYREQQEAEEERMQRTLEALKVLWQKTGSEHYLKGRAYVDFLAAELGLLTQFEQEK